MIGRGFKASTFEFEHRAREHTTRILINGEYVMDGKTGKPAEYTIRAGDAEQLKRTVAQLMRMG